MSNSESAKDLIAIFCSEVAFDEMQPIARALSREYTVMPTDSSVNGIQAVIARKPKAILLSVNLTHLSALEVARRISNAALEGRPPVLAMGNHGDIRLSALKSHDLVDDVVELPAGDGLILQRLYDLLDVAVERQWENLNRVQRGLLKITKKSLDAVAQAAVEGRPLPEAAVAECCQGLVAAARSDNLVGAMEGLRNHHNSTYVHSLRVAANMTLFGVGTGMKDIDVEVLARSGLLHDVGKMTMPIEILNKPGRLDDAEWEVMRQHTVLSGEALRRSDGVAKEVIQVAERHHEKIDGTGYPNGLIGAAIDDLSLICAISDVHAALTEKRSYKRPMDDEKALGIMAELAGDHLEPAYFRQFQALILDGKRGRANAA